MEKRFDLLGTYEYTCVDGTVLKLRRMSDRERQKFLSGQAIAMHRKASKLHDQMQEDGAPEWEDLTKFIKTLAKLIKGIAMSKEASAVLGKLDESEYWVDSILMFFRVFGAEFAIAAGEDVPEQIRVPLPDEVEELPDDKVASLGEDSPPNSQATDTSPESVPAETCSSGAKPSTKRKRKTCATSQPR